MRMCLILLSGVLALPLSAEIKISKPFQYQGMCDASAGVAIDAHLFAVADDEDSRIRVYRNDQEGPPIQIINLNRFLELDPFHPETDLEGAAAIGDCIYWIGSHGRNQDGKDRPGRQRLFGTTLKVSPQKVELNPVGKPYKNLLRDLIREPRFKSLNFAAASRLAPKLRGGLNIEGLAATSQGHLLIGFRNPLHQRKALVVPLLNPREVLNGTPSRFGDIIELDLDGLGIRDMVFTGEEYLIIGGSFDSRGHSRLFRWAGDSTPPEPIDVNHFKKYNPEALIVYPDRDTERIQVLSDDGNRSKGGKRCKDLKDASAKTFRGFWIKF